MWRLPITALLLMMMSCSIQKRLYTKGFYVHHQTGKTELRKAPIRDQQQTFNGSKSFLKSYGTRLPDDNREDFGNGLSLLSSKSNPDTCDVIIFRDGTEEKAKVLEVGMQAVKYARCDTGIAFTHSVSKSGIFVIKYSNGTRDVFKEEALPKKPVIDKPERFKKPPRTLHPGALLTMVLGILGLVFRLIAFFIVPQHLLTLLAAAFIIFCIILLVYSKQLVREIKAKPYTTKGVGFANTGFILALINLVVNVITLFTLLLFF